MKTPIKVFVVDDSTVARELLIHIIQSDPALQVVGYAENGKQAIEWLEGHTPDVVTMDIHMPVIDGFEVTRRIMGDSPVPIIIISSGYKVHDAEQAFKAMEAGALAILEKPEAYGTKEYQRQSQEIIEKIKVVSSIKLVKRKTFLPFHPEITPPVHNIEIVGIGASLGGPVAIAHILENLPPNFPVPILIVQHIASGFTDGFVKWLNDTSALPVKVPKHNELALPGHVYIAPDNCHMGIGENRQITLDCVPGASYLQPSIGYLFKSMGDVYGKKAVGVILTGMGRDGANELLSLRKKGGYTIAQDEETCVMFGIPKEAIRLGAIDKVLPLDYIGEALKLLVMKKIFSEKR